MRFARKRDANERAIITALRAAGCAVTQLEGAGVPDLAVEKAGVMRLVEVKDVKPGAVSVHRGKNNDDDDPAYRELTAAQVKWWRSWNGTPPVIVHDVAEALAVFGQERSMASARSTRD